MNAGCAMLRLSFSNNNAFSTALRILSYHLRKNCFKSSSTSALIRYNCSITFEQDKRLCKDKNDSIFNKNQLSTSQYSLGSVLKDLTDNQFIEKLNTKWSKLSPTEILNDFEVLSNYAQRESINISSNIFDDFIDSFTDKICQMTDEQLENIFLNLRKWPKQLASVRNFIEIWTALDDAILNRTSTFKIEQFLLFLSHICKTNLIRHFEFSTYALNKLATKAKKLNPSQLFQTVYYISINKVEPFDVINIEFQFSQYIDIFTIEEIGIICFNLSKKNIIFRNPALLEKIIDILVSQADTIKEDNLRGVLMMLKKSVNQLELQDPLCKMLNAYSKRVSDFTSVTLVYFLLIQSKILVKHTTVLEEIVKNFMKNSSSFKISHIKGLLFTIGLLRAKNILHTQLHDTILQELRDPKREQEIKDDGQSFVYCLHHLALDCIFPLDLINKALDPDFIDRSLSNYVMKGKDLLSLSISVELECESYKGYLLDDIKKNKIARRHNSYNADLTGEYKNNFILSVMADIMILLEKTRGKKHMVAKHLLPHYGKGDIVFCNNADGSPCEVESYFPESTPGKIHWSPDPTKTWFAVVLYGGQILYNSTELIGPLQMKIRQLKKIGYVPLLVKCNDWKILENDDEKVEFLNELIKSTLNV